MRRFLALSLFVALPLILSARSAQAAQPVVDVVKVDGVIDRAMADYLIGTIDDAEAAGSTVVLQLNTPGALNVDALRIAERVFEAKVPVVVWVGPSGARATGVGYMLVYASSFTVMSPGSGIGPLEPLDLGTKPSSEDPADRTRAMSELQAWATARDRPSPASTAGTVLTAQDALLDGVAQCARGVEFTGDNPEDCAAVDVADLLRKIDGRVVQTAAGTATLATKISPERPVLIRFHDLGIGRRILHAVSAPVPIYILLVLGLAGIAFELTQAGFGFAGISGLLCLGLAGFGLAVVPFDPLGLALFLGGTGLLTLDALLRKLGVLSALGIVAFVWGSLTMFGDAAPAIDLSPWLIGGAALAVGLYYALGLTVAMKARERIVTTQVGLVGLVGETRGTLNPEGPVYVKGTLWRGKSGNGPIPPGTTVRVRGVDGLILRVEPEEGPPA
jgi:membrane-bound serine protease (ClpP class)